MDRYSYVVYVDGREFSRHDSEATAVAVATSQRAEAGKSKLWVTEHTHTPEGLLVNLRQVWPDFQIPKSMGGPR